MTIKEFMDLPITDEQESVVVFKGNVNNPHRHYTGKLCDMPIGLQNRSIDIISAMGQHRIEKYHLNQYGWLEIWLQEDKD